MSKTSDLARWFVNEVLCRSWTEADWGGSHMAHAKKLLKAGYSAEDIRGACTAIQESPEDFGLWKDFKLQYLTTLLKFEPPLIEQYLQNKVPPPPPVYQVASYDAWVAKFGREAVELGIWDGVYQPLGEKGRLTIKEIARILG